MSLKFKDEGGKVVGVLKDDASEPEMEEKPAEKTEEKPCCGNCKCHEEDKEEGDKE